MLFLRINDAINSTRKQKLVHCEGAQGDFLIPASSNSVVNLNRHKTHGSFLFWKYHSQSRIVPRCHQHILSFGFQWFGLLSVDLQNCKSFDWKSNILAEVALQSNFTKEEEILGCRKWRLPRWVWREKGPINHWNFPLVGKISKTYHWKCKFLRITSLDLCATELLSH